MTTKGEFEDEDALNAKRLADKLDKAFSRYYKQEKARLERKQKDLVALFFPSCSWCERNASLLPRKNQEGLRIYA